MTKQNESTDELQIRRLIEDKIGSIRAKDIDGVMASYASDFLSFDVINPLQYSGSDDVRKRLEQWFASFEGPIDLEIRDLKISAASDVAFSHCLNHVIATTKDGATLDMWWRETACYRKIAGRWIITHQHSSVPFDPQTGKASIDLKP
jgi:uncharacterized protein (TIGR02246 family)